MKLVAILAELHIFEGVANWAQPLRLGVAVEGRPFLRICERRGDSITLDEAPLEPADLGEGGRVEVFDLTARLDPTLSGAQLEAVRRIEDGEGRLLGVALMRRPQGPFCIWIEDDEFYWGSEPALKSAPFPEGLHPVIGAPV